MYKRLADSIRTAQSAKNQSLLPVMQSSSGWAAGVSYVPSTGNYYLHQGETVTPSNASSGGIVVNILGGTYLSENVAEEIGNKIIDRLKSNLRI